MRNPSKDEVFAVLLIQKIDGDDSLTALTKVYGREPNMEEIHLFHKKCVEMRRGWVEMDYLRLKRI